MDSITNVQCLSIIVCAGRSEVPEMSRELLRELPREMPREMSMVLTGEMSRELPREKTRQKTRAMSKSTPTANIYLTIDIDNRVKPDIVGDLRTIHRQFHNNSIKLIVFRYCPLSIYSDKCISKWMQKLKPMGIMIFFGPLATDHFFQMLLKNHATSSRRIFRQFVYNQCLVLQRS